MLMYLIVIVALILWSCLYLTLNLWFPKLKCEWHCRVVTCVHAIVIVALSAWSVFILGPWPFYEPAMPNNQLQEFTCAISLGYFLFDFIWCIYFRTEGPVMLFHHVLSMVGNMYVLYYGSNGGEMLATLFGTEITNPLLQLRWFIRQNANLSSSFLATAVDMAFLVMFTIMRIIIATVLFYNYQTHPRPDTFAKVGSVSIYLIGWVFWIAVVRYAWRKYVLQSPGKCRHDTVKADLPAASAIPPELVQKGANRARGDSASLDNIGDSVVRNTEAENGLVHRSVVGTNGDREGI